MVHELALALLYVPAEQSAQVTVPVDAANFPAAHSVHVAAPSGEYRPEEQSKHSAALASEYLKKVVECKPLIGRFVQG